MCWIFKDLKKWSDNMANLNLYKSFYDVVRYDGFTNASKATNISQPALSYSIKWISKKSNGSFKK